MDPRLCPTSDNACGGNTISFTPQTSRKIGKVNGLAAGGATVSMLWTTQTGRAHPRPAAAIRLPGRVVR